MTDVPRCSVCGASDYDVGDVMWYIELKAFVCGNCADECLREAAEEEYVDYLYAEDNDW